MAIPAPNWKTSSIVNILVGLLLGLLVWGPTALADILR